MTVEYNLEAIFKVTITNTFKAYTEKCLMLKIYSILLIN